MLYDFDLPISMKLILNFLYLPMDLALKKAMNLKKTILQNGGIPGGIKVQYFMMPMS